MAEISRRALLSRAALATGAGSIGLGAVLGLTRPVHHRVAVPPPAPPTALTDALHRQRVLLAGYNRLRASNPAGPAYLTGLRADVSAHGQALLALLERYPGWRLAQASPNAPSSADAPAAASITSLATASLDLAAAVRAACLRWPVDEPNAEQVVPVLGSIAASLSCHALILDRTGS